MNGYIKRYICENYKMLSILIIFLAIGIVAGIFSFNVIDSGTKDEIIHTMKSTLDISKSPNFEGFNIIINGIISNILLILVIYFTALTFICPYLLSTLTVTKGFAIGIYIPTLFNIFGLKNGIISILLMLILPNLIYIPSYLYTCINSINLSNKIIQGESKITLLITEIIKCVVVISVVFVGIIIEQFTSFFVISMYSGIA